MISVLCAIWLSFNFTKKYNPIELLSVHQEVLSASSFSLAPRLRLPVPHPSAPSSSSGNLRKTEHSSLMGLWILPWRVRFCRTPSNDKHMPPLPAAGCSLATAHGVCALALLVTVTSNHGGLLITACSRADWVTVWLPLASVYKLWPQMIRRPA